MTKPLLRAVTDEGHPRVKITTNPDAVRQIGDLVDSGLVPHTYVTDGTPVVLTQVSGTAIVAAGDEDAPLPRASQPITAPVLAGLLAHHTVVTRPTMRPDGATQDVEVMPSQSVLQAVLSARYWPRLRPLRAVIGAPVLRADGTLLQTPGYDPATGFYLAPTVDVGVVPEQPTPTQVCDAREFLLGRFLADFPWRSAADRANYVAVMVTQILRPYTRALSPWVIVDATTPSSGKTILTAAVGMLYGQRVMTWAESEDELRKAITSVMAQDVGCVVFDNLAEGAVIQSAVLARLVTERTWTDRKLGSSSTISFENNRLWMATGNNLRTGADMASRSVWIRLDPNCPAPEERTGFSIPNLDSWILDKTNQAHVLRAVLTLVMDWTAAGAPRDYTIAPMRQFTIWAQTVGGLLAHHQIPGFLANKDETKSLDEDAADWRAFLLTWHRKFLDTPTTAAAVRATAELDPTMPDPWDGTFIADPKGRLPSARSLGRLLTGQIGRWRGDVVLRSHTETNGHGRQYWVERGGDFATTPNQTAKPLNRSHNLLTWENTP